MRKVWKKIEHWIAIAIIIGSIAAPLIMHAYPVELGLLPEISDDPGDMVTECYGDPKWPC